MNSKLSTQQIPLAWTLTYWKGHFKYIFLSNPKFVYIYLRNWSERSACAALAHCRQNVVAAFNSVFFFFLSFFFFLFQAEDIGKPL
jgi:hypothetical protein